MSDSASAPGSGAAAQPHATSAPTPKLRFGALTALAVGSMIGGGTFSPPQTMAVSADACAVLMGWAITAVGMLTLAFVFQPLANRKPELDGGAYIYAKEGFGDYRGFSSAWGSWTSAWLGNVGYYVLLFSTFGYFFPIVGKGNRRSPSPAPAPACGSGACISSCCRASRKRPSSTSSPRSPGSCRSSCSS